MNFPCSFLTQGLVSFVTLSMLFQLQRWLGAQHVSTQSGLKILAQELVTSSIQIVTEQTNHFNEESYKLE